MLSDELNVVRENNLQLKAVLGRAFSQLQQWRSRSLYLAPLVEKHAPSLTNWVATWRCPAGPETEGWVRFRGEVYQALGKECPRY